MTQAQHLAATTDTAHPSSTKNAQQLLLVQEALQNVDKALIDNPDHSWLLRYRAMILDEQGDPSAYQAYQAAQRELRLRVAYPAVFSPQPAEWLRKVEARLAALKPQQPVDAQEAIIEDCLAAGDYLQAHHLLQSVPADRPIRTWFERRLEVDKETNDVRLKTRRHDPLTLVDSAALASAGYQLKHNQPLALVGVWEETDRLLSDEGDGYAGYACKHIATDAIAIIHCGTDWTKPADLFTDFLLAMGKASSQFEQARKFAAKALEGVKPHPSQQVCHIGHSKGGILAVHTALTSSPAGSHRAVSIDGPSYYRLGKLGGLTPEQLQNLPVISCVTDAILINYTGGLQLGRVIYIPIELSKAVKRWREVLLQAPAWTVPLEGHLPHALAVEIGCHGLAQILDVLSSWPDRVCYLPKWPTHPTAATRSPRVINQVSFFPTSAPSLPVPDQTAVGKPTDEPAVLEHKPGSAHKK